MTYSANHISSVRQTVLSCPYDSSLNGPSWLPTSAASLSPSTLSTITATTPLLVSAAMGFGPDGEKNRFFYTESSFTIPNVPANAYSYVYFDINSNNTITPGFSPIQPQYGDFYNRTKNMLLHFEGTNGSTTILDDYGNAWTRLGTATISNTRAKFGSTSLLTNSTSGAYTTVIPDFSGSWTMEVNIYPTSFAALFDLLSGRLVNTTQTGFVVRSAVTTGQISLWISSAGSSWDISNGVTGSTNLTLNAWNHVALVFDGSNYRLYLNGAQIISFASTTKMNTPPCIAVGSNGDGVNGMPGTIDEFRFSPCCRYYAAFTAPTAAFSVEGDFFSTSAMKMFSVTGASTAAGSDPTMTQRVRVYIGEMLAGASTVTSITTYAARGTASFTQASLAVSTQYTFQHNIGVADLDVQSYLECKTADQGYARGDRVYFMGDGNSGSASAYYGTFPTTNSKTVYLTTGPSGIGIMRRDNGTVSVLTTASWQAGVFVKRRW